MTWRIQVWQTNCKPPVESVALIRTSEGAQKMFSSIEDSSQWDWTKDVVTGECRKDNFLSSLHDLTFSVLSRIHNVQKILPFSPLVTTLFNVFKIYNQLSCKELRLNKWGELFKVNHYFSSYDSINHLRIWIEEWYVWTNYLYCAVILHCALKKYIKVICHIFYNAILTCLFNSQRCPYQSCQQHGVELLLHRRSNASLHCLYSFGNTYFCLKNNSFRRL